MFTFNQIQLIWIHQIEQEWLSNRVTYSYLNLQLISVIKLIISCAQWIILNKNLRQPVMFCGQRANFF